MNRPKVVLYDTAKPGKSGNHHLIAGATHEYVKPQAIPPIMPYVNTNQIREAKTNTNELSRFDNKNRQAPVTMMRLVLKRSCNLPAGIITRAKTIINTERGTIAEDFDQPRISPNGFTNTPHEYDSPPIKASMNPPNTTDQRVPQTGLSLYILLLLRH